MKELYFNGARLMMEWFRHLNRTIVDLGHRARGGNTLSVRSSAYELTLCSAILMVAWAGVLLGMGLSWLFFGQGAPWFIVHMGGASGWMAKLMTWMLKGMGGLCGLLFLLEAVKPSILAIKEIKNLANRVGTQIRWLIPKHDFRARWLLLLEKDPELATSVLADASRGRIKKLAKTDLLPLLMNKDMEIRQQAVRTLGKLAKRERPKYFWRQPT